MIVQPQSDDVRNGTFQAPLFPATPPLGGREIGDADFPAGRDHVVRVHHGTTHAFDSFDASRRGNPEGAFGSVSYFTSSFEDAERNYACEGPDLETRVETAAERLACEMECDPEAHGLTGDECHDTRLERATALVRAGLVGSTPRVITCLVRFSNPFLVDGALKAGRGLRSLSRDTTPRLLPEEDDAYDTARQDVIDEMGLQDLEGDALEEAFEAHEDLFHEKLDERRAAVLERLADAIASASLHYGIEIPDLPQSIFMETDSLTHQEFYNTMLADETILHIECPETGALIGNDFFSRVVEELGFDAIVLRCPLWRHLASRFLRPLCRGLSAALLASAAQQGLDVLCGAR